MNIPASAGLDIEIHGDSLSLLFSRGEYRLLIDHGNAPGGAVFISHAHSDHVRLLGQRDAPEGVKGALDSSCTAITSNETRRLLEQRYPALLRRCQIYEEGAFSHPNMAGHEARLVPNGHMLGSRGLVVPRDPSSKEALFFLTGDFTTHPARLFPPAVPVKTDILACECTFGDPKYEFPPYPELKKEIVDWIDTSLRHGPVVLYGYSLGKNQELLSLLWPFADRVTILADEETCKMAGVYRACGVPLPVCEPVKKYEGGTYLEESKNYILLQPPGARFSDRYKKLDNIDCRRAIFSGWARNRRWVDRFNVDAGFPLSDHPCFSDIVSFIEACSPSTVILHHGDGTAVKRKLQEKLKGYFYVRLPRDVKIVTTAGRG
jgi:Cft2 family RNA processing exonuclease